MAGASECSALWTATWTSGPTTLKRHAWDRITFDHGDDIYPLWSPDDTSIVFGAVRKSENVVSIAPFSVLRRATRNCCSPTTEGGLFPMDCLRRRPLPAVQQPNAQQNVDLWALPLDKERKPFEVVRTNFNETMAQFSPDGKWIAYQSNKTGRDEIYLRAFPGPGTDIPVSSNGGGQVRWNPSGGKELFYVAADDQLMAVPIDVSPDGKTLEPGTASPLFMTRIGSTATLKFRQQYVVSRDGQSFVMQSAVAQPTASPITVILNWKPAR